MQMSALMLSQLPRIGEPEAWSLQYSGCCWAFSTVASVGVIGVQLSTSKLVSLSEQELRARGLGHLRQQKLGAVS